MNKNSTPMLDEHLQILQQMQEVDAEEFFYTRLRARMELQHDSGWVLPFRPVWVLGCLMILFVINAFLLAQEWKEQKSESASTIQEFAKSYDQTISTPY
jgi:hypothetical protein